MCFGCGSPDLISSDNKCTPSLQSIKTHIINGIKCGDEAAGAIAEQIFTTKADATHKSEESLQCTDEKHRDVQFAETLFVVDGTKRLKSYVAAQIG